MLGFQDSEKVGGVPNKIFSLVIASTIESFGVYRVLIHDGKSCDIIYSELFEKVGFERGSMWPYE